LNDNFERGDKAWKRVFMVANMQQREGFKLTYKDRDLQEISATNEERIMEASHQRLENESN